MSVLFLSTARIEEMKQDLLHKISILGKELPLNTLDELIDKFGGPDKVSEVENLITQSSCKDIHKIYCIYNHTLIKNVFYFPCR